MPWHASAVPLGLSFFSLQAIGYLADVGRGAREAEKDLSRFAAYLARERHMPVGNGFGAYVVQVHIRLEEANRAVEVIHLHDQLSQSHLHFFELAGDLCALADQAGEDVLVYHAGMVKAGRA